MNRSESTENTIQIIILLLIGAMAGAASFTHVHDWTMRNVPPGTSGWFGWANAVISELTPTAAGLEIRRRKRTNRPIAYPMTVLIAAAALSLTAQVAQAKPGPTGWLVSAVPALAFLALTKLVISRSASQAHTQPVQPATAEPSPPQPAPPNGQLPTELLTGARMAAFNYRQTTGQDITADTLASHLAIAPDLAGQLLHALGGTGITAMPPTVTSTNGTPGSRP
jgi:hypothetical protein